MDFLYKPPKFVKSFFRGVIWDNTNEGIILTIDDGPSENTFKILDILDKYNLKAIFFCSGKNIERHFNEFNAIVKSGHRIENHGYNHKRLMFKGKKCNFREIEKTNRIIKELTGKGPSLFRPPYGLFNLNTFHAINKSGMKMMLWSFLTGDHTGDFAQVRRLTDSYLDRNSIIVLHDNEKAKHIFDQSLEHIVKTAKEKNFFFNNLNEKVLR